MVHMYTYLMLKLTYYLIKVTYSGNIIPKQAKRKGKKGRQKPDDERVTRVRAFSASTENHHHRNFVSNAYTNIFHA